MMIGNNEEYVQAYTETYCVLQHFPKDFLDRLPTELLEMIQSKFDEKYKIDVDVKKSIQEHNISQTAKNILTVLKYNFWSNDEEKALLKQKFYENEKKFQEDFGKEFNSDDLFRKKGLIQDENDAKVMNYKKDKRQIEDVDAGEFHLIKYKEPWIDRVMRRVKMWIEKIRRK